MLGQGEALVRPLGSPRAPVPLRATPLPLSLCQRCEKNVASVHVVDVETFVSFRHPDNEVVSQSLCESCGSPPCTFCRCSGVPR